MAMKKKLGTLRSRDDSATRIDSRDGPNPTVVEVQVEDSTVYKVYKRRWIGVVFIMLLNIVSSWRYELFRFAIHGAVGYPLLQLPVLHEITSGCRPRPQ